ncbi:hypothetical protein PF006_g24369 [Phytophthora fragariae]|uniref:RxLR effector protein n=1 Tax=Phytophthora fragariae TaxID=53985 RepID=A0A6A3RCG5_9STRA|nr:hypothetical protein PF006_g24369 [Phytophthora fragariae]
MQFGFYLLVIAAILLVGSDVVTASIDVDTTVSKTSSNLLTSGDAVSAGRFLRTSEIADAANEDEDEESDDEERYLPSIVTEKAAGAAAKLTRSKSLSSEKAALQKLKRSKSAKLLNTKLTLEQVEHKFRKSQDRSLFSHFKIMDKQNQNPDQMFKFYRLDKSLAGTTVADTTTLQRVTKGNDEILGQYITCPHGGFSASPGVERNGIVDCDGWGVRNQSGVRKRILNSRLESSSASPRLRSERQHSAVRGEADAANLTERRKAIRLSSRSVTRRVR